MENAEHNIRLVIHGEVDGFATELYIYDTDIERAIEEEQFLPYEVGMIQELTQEIKQHNVTPSKKGGTRGKSDDEGESSRSNKRTGKRKKKWECPEHGDEYVDTDYFDKSKMKCQYKEEADEDDDDAPDWANPDKDGGPRYSKKEDTYYWYCRHKER